MAVDNYDAANPPKARPWYYPGERENPLFSFDDIGMFFLLGVQVGIIFCAVIDYVW